MQQGPTFYLNSNDGSSILAFGMRAQLRVDEGAALDKMDEFLQAHAGSYIFTCLNYDLKNEIEALESSQADGVRFPLLYLCIPACVVKLDKDEITYLEGEATEETERFIRDFFSAQSSAESDALEIHLAPKISRKNYLKQVRSLQTHLQKGDIYEVNFCQEFAAEDVVLNEPEAFYFKLNAVTKAPYSAYVHFDEFDVFCASPECYLSRRGATLRSYPIKGTYKRGRNAEEDARFKTLLLHDQKERSENVMIVDLVRNDLSRLATKDSVRVEELFGIYTFETVHQMISTVACTLRETLSFSEILRATFPMGSMTGAPKVRAMQLIESHENFCRGLYSGSIGLIQPNGDFDFNVVIRSVLYNRAQKYLSCAVGSAITIHADPEKEYAECETKIQRILSTLHVAD